MSQPLQFDQVQAAQRMRDAMASVAREQARIISPPPMIARMTNVDLKLRTGEAWIIGDTEPVPVVLSSTIVPASWDNKDGFDEQLQRQIGGGSVVVLNNYNGTLYVTQILSGGQLMNQQNAYGINLVSQMTDTVESHYSGGRGGVGFPYEHYFVINLECGEEAEAQATEFGPFEMFWTSPGRIDMVVSSELHSGSHSRKIYNFLFNPEPLFTRMGYDQIGGTQYNKWFRLLPVHEQLNGTPDDPNDLLNDYANAPCDFDIDICLRIDPTGDTNGLLWFRYVRYTPDLNSYDVLVSIRSTSLSIVGNEGWGGGGGGAQKIQQKHIAPTATLEPIRGYLGFHNSFHMFHDTTVAATTKTPYRQNVQWETGPWRSANLRLADNLQRTWDLAHTDNFTWTGSNLSWTGTLKFSGVGYHRNGIEDGSLTVSMPAVNSTIPVMGNHNTSVTVTSAGIPLAQYQALYLAIPPGVLNDSNVQQRFFIVDDFDGAYQLPEWAVMIASRPRGSDMLRLGNGQQLDYWHAPAFLNGWTNWGGGYHNVGFMKHNGLVLLKGLAKIGTTNLAFILPAGYRPAAYVMFAVPNSEAAALMQVGNDGTVNKYNGGTSYMGLDNIRFKAEQ